MIRRAAVLGLAISLSLSLLIALRASLVQGIAPAKQMAFSPPRLLTASPTRTSTLHPVDIDNDGDLDIFASGLVDGKVVWYENRGLAEPEFTIHTLGMAFEYVDAIETADLDGDGDLDVLVGAINAQKIYWYENQGGTPLTFVEHLAAADINKPRSVKTADLDDDGDLDILTASFEDNTIAWYENSGAVTPTFVKQVVSTFLDGAYAVYPADINGDGFIDIVAAAKTANAVVWYEHDGGTTPVFAEHVITTTAVAAVAVTVADVDADGDLDVLSASTDDNTVAWYENDGASSPAFTSHMVSDVAELPGAVYTADVDGDGDLDVISTSDNSGKLIWYESDGAAVPKFTAHEVAGTAYAKSVHAYDLDDDNDLELLTLRYKEVVWYENDGAALPNFTFHYAVTPTLGAHGVFAADLDSDGDIDVLSASADDGRVAWFENDGGPAPEFTAHTITTDTERPLRVIAAHINDDLHLDVVSSSRVDGKIAWYANDGSRPPVLTMFTITTGLKNPVSLDAADLDSDGDLDLISGAENIPVAWYENSGGAMPTFTTHEVYTDITGVFAIKAVDLDGDQDIDIVGGSANENLYWFESDGGAPPNFKVHLVDRFLYAQHVYAADVNGDGFTDILSTSGLYWNNNTVAWYENDGTLPPSFTPHTISTDTVTTKFVYATDIDKDGDMDVFSASQGDDKIAWYENDGANPPNFTTHVLSEKADGARSLYSADLNGDGHEELLFASFEDGKIGWHENLPPLYELFLPIVAK